MNNGEEKKTNLFAAAALGCGAGLLLALLFILVCALITLGTENPMSYTWLGVAALFAFALASGIISGKISGRASLLTGLLSGGMYAAVVFCSSLLMPQSAGRLWYIPIVLLCSVIGAILEGVRHGGKPRMPSL